MNKVFFFIILITFSFFKAGAQDSIFVKSEGKVNYFEHSVRKGETIFSVASVYNVPPSKLTGFNGKNYMSNLEINSILYIPIDKFNYIRINSVVKSKPLYYQNSSNLSYKELSKQFNIPSNLIQQWNKLSPSDQINGRTIQIGWIHYEVSEKKENNKEIVMDSQLSKKRDPQFEIGKKSKHGSNTVGDSQILTNAQDSSILLKDSLYIEEKEEESQFEQIFWAANQGYSLFSESGAAVFFPMKMNVGEGVYYAFHNSIPRGTIVKIENPANGNIIYAKVIGNVPTTKEFQNAVIGISNNAIRYLSAKDKRMFCKIEYGN